MKKTVYLAGIVLMLTGCGSLSNAQIQGHVQSVHNKHFIYQRAAGKNLEALNINGKTIPLLTDGESKHGFTRNTSSKHYQLINSDGIHRYGYYFDREKETGHLFALAKPTDNMPDISNHHYMGDMIYQQSNENKFAIYSFNIEIKDNKRFKMSSIAYAKHLGDPETHLLPIEKATGETNKDIEIEGTIKGNRLIGKLIRLKNEDTDTVISVQHAYMKGYFSGSNAESISGVIYGKTRQFEFSGSFGGRYIRPVCAPGSRRC